MYYVFIRFFFCNEPNKNLKSDTLLTLSSYWTSLLYWVGKMGWAQNTIGKEGNSLKLPNRQKQHRYFHGNLEPLRYSKPSRKKKGKELCYINIIHTRPHGKTKQSHPSPVPSTWPEATCFAFISQAFPRVPRTLASWEWQAWLFQLRQHSLVLPSASVLSLATAGSVQSPVNQNPERIWGCTSQPWARLHLHSPSPPHPGRFSCWLLKEFVFCFLLH